MKALRTLLSLVERPYLALDKRLVRRTRNLELIPDLRHRRMGRNSYGEWAHVIGLFQSLIHLYLGDSPRPHVLDVGCGTGILGIAAAPSLGEHGRYTGIDVIEENIRFCRRHFCAMKGYDFQLLPVRNPTYNREVGDARPWEVPSDSIDLVTALSVWTHLDQDDAVFYFREIDRCLRPGGAAVVTLFLLDEAYRESLRLRSHEPGRFHRTPADRWIFDRPTSAGGHWYHPSWVTNPEDAIALTPQGVELMLAGTTLRLERHLPGHWKERPGLYFQDIAVFRKPVEDSVSSGRQPRERPGRVEFHGGDTGE